MEFRIADTFIDSLARLTGDEQKAVKTTTFDLQVNPDMPSFSFHKLDRAKDKRFWSVRVSRDIRLIVHRTDTSLLLCYVDHHDAAYDWAERRKLETHPKTGAAQLVEIRERVEEIRVPVMVEQEAPTPSPSARFAGIEDDVLLGFGVPPEWLADVRHADDDGLLALAEHLPQEAAEALLELATGGQPSPGAVAPSPDPFRHPDAQRRFRVMADIEELSRALDFPWDKWSIFLHPAQREIVEKELNGPARVSGSAGTGKTIVALHRAVYLARRHPDARVLLTTFSEPLANALRDKLGRLIRNEPKLAERLEVQCINDIGERLYRLHLGHHSVAQADDVRALIAKIASTADTDGLSTQFLRGEWDDVVDAWQLDTWEAYRSVKRLGRKTRLPEKRRAVIWRLFEDVRAALRADGRITRAELFTHLAQRLGGMTHPPFDFAVVDEAQDVNVPQLRFLASLAGNRANGLFFAGDLGQRIFQQPFSWKTLGIDIRGRSRTLHVNYRTSHQIRSQADRLLGPKLSDVDGNTEDRRGTVSVFNGPPPQVESLDSPEEEIAFVGTWLAARSTEGVEPSEMAVFVRTRAQLDRAKRAVQAAGLNPKTLDEHLRAETDQVSVCTMHLAKGLEFRAVAVMACDDEVIPLQERIERITDEADLEDVYNTERHLLYVACTRARDQLLVTSGELESEFMDDLVPRC